MPIALLTGPTVAEQPPRLFCTFRLGEQLFGVDVADVKEVNPETTLTPVHHAPPQVLGYVNLRGQIYLVLDLRQLLGLPAGRPGQDSRLLIFKPSVGDSLAGLVDRIGDIVAVDPSRIEPWAGKTSDGLSPAAGELLAGVAQLDKELLLILQAAQFRRVIEDAMDA